MMDKKDNVKMNVDNLEGTVMTVDEEGMREFLELRSPQMPSYMRDIVMDIFFRDVDDAEGAPRVFKFSADMVLSQAVYGALEQLDEAINERLGGDLDV